MVNLGQGHLLTLASLSSIHTFQRSSSLNETAWPIIVKFYVEHPWVGEMKV